jgi:hypothetical protein
MSDKRAKFDSPNPPETRKANMAPQRAASGAPLDSCYMGGLQGLIATTRHYIAKEGETSQVIQRLGEDCAFIRWQDMRSPLKFLRQAAGHPPLRLGVEGFRPELVDDKNPARHYMAFVVMGYHLPYLLALVVLYLWEIAGFVRYGFKWSKPDMQSGLIGVRHGQAIRRQGIEVLPELMAADLGVKAFVEG